MLPRVDHEGSEDSVPQVAEGPLPQGPFTLSNAAFAHAMRMCVYCRLQIIPQLFEDHLQSPEHQEAVARAIREDEDPEELHRIARGIDPIYCQLCDVWLNGISLWTDHTGNHRHRKNLQRQAHQQQAQLRNAFGVSSTTNVTRIASTPAYNMYMIEPASRAPLQSNASETRIEEQGLETRQTVAAEVLSQLPCHATMMSSGSGDNDSEIKEELSGI